MQEAEGRNCLCLILIPIFCGKLISKMANQLFKALVDAIAKK
ncbi:hypothetical protein [Nostoc sp. PA-18-2419]|nr:hypothetical protein [Nostoc sp. PA-18-2419]